MSTVPQYLRPLDGMDGRGVAGVPLYNKEREIVDWAIVDHDAVGDLCLVRWYRTFYGYAGTSGGGTGGRDLLMHRFILDLEFGDKRQADHINGNRLDNRLANLRIVTAAENRQNQHQPDRGASYRPELDRWIAQACGKYLGSFKTRDEAFAAASAYRREHLPFSAMDQS